MSRIVLKTANARGTVSRQAVRDAIEAVVFHSSTPNDLRGPQLSGKPAKKSPVRQFAKKLAKAAR